MRCWRCRGGTSGVRSCEGMAAEASAQRQVRSGKCAAASAQRAAPFIGQQGSKAGWAWLVWVHLAVLLFWPAAMQRAAGALRAACFDGRTHMGTSRHSHTTARITTLALSQGPAAFAAHACRMGAWHKLKRGTGVAPLRPVPGSTTSPYTSLLIDAPASLAWRFAFSLHDTRCSCLLVKNSAPAAPSPPSLLPLLLCSPPAAPQLHLRGDALRRSCSTVRQCCDRPICAQQRRPLKQRRRAGRAPAS